MTGRPQQKATPLFPPCDQCLHRKIRCDKSLPRCHRCSDANLDCTREVVRQRPGRKKGSGVVISRLRNSGNAEGENSTKPGLPEERPAPELQDKVEALNRLEGEPGPSNVSGHTLGGLNNDAFFSAGPKSSHNALSQRPSYDSPANKPTAFESPETIISNIPNLTQYVDLFFTRLYPIWPVIDELAFRESLEHPEDLDHHQRCLILSICSLTALHIPGSTAPASEPRQLIAQRFVEQCIQVRSMFDYIETANISTIHVSLFLSCALVEFQKTRASWFLLQEAIMLAQELGFYEPPGISPELGQSTVLSIHRTLYILSLTERGLTILRNKPFKISMFDSPSEQRFKNEDPRILVGLQSLSRLFGLLDKQFLDTWVNGREDTTSAAVAQATVKVLTAQRTLANMTFDIDNLIDIQKADILITQQWMRLVFWQSSMRQGLLSSAAEDPALSYQFPAEIAKSLCSVLKFISTTPLVIHGMAIFERIFEITYSFIDSLSLSQTLSSGLEELRLLFRVLRESPNSHHTYIQILETKLIEQAENGGEGLVTLIYQLPPMKV